MSDGSSEDPRFRSMQALPQHLIADPPDSATPGFPSSSSPSITPTSNTPASNVAPQKTLHSYFLSSEQPHPTQPTLPRSLKRKSPATVIANVDPPKRPRQRGTSKSAQFEAKSRQAADEGRYDSQKFDRFKLKILNLDPNAEFLIDGNPRIVRHSNCAVTVHMKATNNTTAFTKHIEHCKGPTKKRVAIANTDRNCLTKFLNSAASSAATTSLPSITLQCPGLTPERDERIWTYLVRSQAAGGGSRPRHVIAKGLFRKTFGDLRPGQRKKVLRVEAAEFQWINYREQQMILSSKCLKESPSRREPADPCSECIALSKWRVFKNALHREMPKQQNLKFTPHVHRAQISSEQCTRMVGVHEIYKKATAVS